MITNKKKERATCQKKIILDYLRSVKTHPSAEEVYLAVRKKLSRISLGTVYRNLKRLSRSGEIQEISCNSCGIIRYDGNVCPHAHFFCNKCKRIFDVKKKIKKVEKNIKIGKIKNYQIYFYGICKKCAKK